MVDRLGCFFVAFLAAACFTSAFVVAESGRRVWSEETLLFSVNAWTHLRAKNLSAMLNNMNRVMLNISSTHGFILRLEEWKFNGSLFKPSWVHGALLQNDDGTYNGTVWVDIYQTTMRNNDVERVATVGVLVFGGCILFLAAVVEVGKFYVQQSRALIKKETAER